MAVPWKTNLVLDCLHVGEPRPNVLWQHRMRSIRDNSKHQIFPNGSLSIQTLTESDQGNFIVYRIMKFKIFLKSFKTSKQLKNSKCFRVHDKAHPINLWTNKNF